MAEGGTLGAGTVAGEVGQAGHWLAGGGHQNSL